MVCYYDVMAFPPPHKIAVHAIINEFGVRLCLKIETDLFLHVVSSSCFVTENNAKCTKNL